MSIATILFSIIYSNANLENFPFNLILSYIFIPILYTITIYIVKKVEYNKFFKIYYNEKTTKIISTIIFSLLTTSSILIQIIFQKVSNEFLYLFIIIQILLFIITLSYVPFYLNNQERIKAQNALYIEQKEFLSTIEGLQKEMRLFQNNHNNMISSLHSYVKNNDTESIQNFIDESVTNIDKNLIDKIKRSTTLSNIQITELKSLIITKLAKMEQKNIILELEVMYRVQDVNMNITDLVRCLGILLDNAIEAVDSGETIKLILLSESESLSIIISNPTKIKPPITKIWSDGFSTKGNNRGLGLYSYQKIINKYPNAFKQLIIKDNTFTQILKIEK